jgi:hypothetical protein
MNKLTLVLLSAIGGAAAYHFYIRRDERSLSPEMVKPNMAKYIGSPDWSKSKAEVSAKLKAEAEALMAQAKAVREKLKEEYKGYSEAIPSDWDYQAKQLEKAANEKLMQSMQKV